MKTCCFDTNETKTGLIGKKTNVFVFFQEERWKVWTRLSYCTRRDKCDYKSYPNSAIKSSRPNLEVFFPTLGTTFNSCKEGREFYNLYSWEVGFGIRSGHTLKVKNAVTLFRCSNCACLNIKICTSSYLFNTLLYTQKCCLS
jgi:hypothetical protein